LLQNQQIVGLITPHEVRQVARDLWSQTSVQAVMRPLGQLLTVSPETPALEALELMGRHDINQLPVVVNGRLEGIFSRSHIVRFLQAHSQMGRH
jgi:CBS domain-containing protein